MKMTSYNDDTRWWYIPCPCQILVKHSPFKMDAVEKWWTSPRRSYFWTVSLTVNPVSMDQLMFQYMQTFVLLILMCCWFAVPAPPLPPVFQQERRGSMMDPRSKMAFPFSRVSCLLWLWQQPDSCAWPAAGYAASLLYMGPFSTSLSDWHHFLSLCCLASHPFSGYFCGLASLCLHNISVDFCRFISPALSAGLRRFFLGIFLLTSSHPFSCSLWQFAQNPLNRISLLTYRILSKGF